MTPTSPDADPLDHLAAEPLDATDLLVLSELAAALAVADPVPAHLVDDIEFEVSLADMGAELASLIDAPVTVRGPSPTESVTFTASSVSLMIMLDRTSSDSRGLVDVDGWVTGGGVTVTLMQASDRRPVISDANGRVAWTEVARGPVRFLIEPLTRGGQPVITPTIEL